MHCATLSNIQSFDCYVLYLDKKWCTCIQQSLFKNINFLNISNSLIQNKNTYNQFIKLCDDLLRNDILLIEKEERLIDFMNNIFLDFCNENEIRDKNSKNAQLAFKIKTYLKKNINDEILLEDISLNMRLSVVHILRIFKKEFGLPIHSYILNKKVHLAKDLLTKNIPISQVAQDSGFFDQSHLNKSFKRIFQLTPKEYQKNILS